MHDTAPAKGAEIRPLAEGDAGQLFSLIDRNREHLRRWMPWLDENRSVDDSRAFIARSLEQFTRHEGLAEGIWCEGRLAGVVSYVRIDWANRSAAIGYWLGREFEGRGLAAADNARSRALARRLGFAEEGVERQGAWMYDRFVDMAVFSLLRGEWRAGTGPSGARAR